MKYTTPTVVKNGWNSASTSCVCFRGADSGNFTFLQLQYIFRLCFSDILCIISFADVQCMVSSQVPYTLKAYWGVSIRELHLSLWRPWSVLEGQMQDGTILQDHYQHKGVSIQYPLSCRLSYMSCKFCVTNFCTYLEMKHVLLTVLHNEVLVM